MCPRFLALFQHRARPHSEVAAHVGEARGLLFRRDSVTCLRLAVPIPYWVLSTLVALVSVREARGQPFRRDSVTCLICLVPIRYQALWRLVVPAHAQEARGRSFRRGSVV